MIGRVIADPSLDLPSPYGGGTPHTNPHQLEVKHYLQGGREP
jgi:hypothetical protein